MKTVLQEIRFISPFLGSGKPDENGLRRILLNNFKKLTNVTIDKNFQIYPGMVPSDRNVPVFFERKQIYIAGKEQLFESLPVGYTGYLKIQYNPKVWDETYLLNGIKTIANHNGITQFGAKQGYGKFIFTNKKITLNI